MLLALSLAMVLTGGSAGAQAQAVEDARKKCVEASHGPAPHALAQRPVEKFDECIALEANKWPLETRRVICGLGVSGGASGSTVEVYMANDKCRTDYE